MKTNSNTAILESKLKRHKIYFSNEKGKIIIGKPKTDYTTLIGLIVLPIIAAIGITAFLIFTNFEFIGKNHWKIIAGIIFFFGTGIFNLSRVKLKKRLNNNVKTLDYKVIKMKNEFGEKIYDSRNIMDFEYSVKQIDEETYEGNLSLIDNDNTKHQILGFDDENEKYIIDDLKWFSEYLIKHTELKTDIIN
ncbi:hypothetical protein [Lacinutrix sp.]|uniref:hypothetical protein n=1 Tax=Lacinutrix sp. TaxID=1937692 RepID=UPI0025BAF927|nr:hypothetical protein [Lacinutrix sp.]